ncbi:hypothetical protein HaLaN_13047 [Haematococcus lacustris]|uniref:Uncharacterized protein n=1 Tax=Haematococcus lacustris TaxID=44745 RepID=A0A699ZLD4_HAELA|nr:hypothetical protein HaLaN_13047 [Haematococcus lacustris]
MRDAGMLGVLTEQGVTSLPKFRNGALPDSAKPGHYIEGPNKRPASCLHKPMRCIGCVYGGCRWPTDGTHCCLTLAARSSPAPSTDSCTPMESPSA